MAIINFAISDPLETRINSVIDRKGFASKAEFFRFAAIYLIDIVENEPKSEEDRFKHLSKALKAEITKKYAGQKIPPVEKQLEDL